MFEHILLEQEQKELLSILVEGARNLPREKREQFMVVPADIGATNGEIHHLGLPGGHIEAYTGDIDVLINEGLISPKYASYGVSEFDITPRGFAYYQEMKHLAGQPVQQVEAVAKNFLNAERFQRKYSRAYQKWLDAEALLWSSDSERQYTTIGHLCREALQEFVTVLVEEHQPPNVDNDQAHTVARLRAVLNLRANQLGRTAKPFLDALLAYWGTVSDLTQRQEHGGQKEGQPLVWDDARRVVFQTSIVMFEIDGGLSSVH